MHKLFISFLLSLLVSLPCQALTPSAVGDLLVEHRVSPVGLDAPEPRFSWHLLSTINGRCQTAYQIQVALSDDALEASDKPLSWDSGWVAKDQSHLVIYEGAALLSSTPYFWRVRIKDEHGEVSPWSATCRWVTGLMDAEKELTADWIGLDRRFEGAPPDGDWFDIGQAQWICHPGMDTGKIKIGFYRKALTIPADATRVMVGMDVNYTSQFFLNGTELFQAGRVPRYLDITPWIRSGMNHLSWRVYQCSSEMHPGLIASVRIEKKDGSVERLFSDGTWESTAKEVDLWSVEGKADDGWAPVRVLGKPGEPNTTGMGKPTLFLPLFTSATYLPPAVYLRKEITINKPVRFAVFHGTAQGLYDLHLNGRRLTPSGFQPGWTQFDRHISYVSTEVTEALKPGRNAVGAVLADGWFRGNLLWNGREGFGTRLRFSGQLEVEYTDGARELFRTDPSWKTSFGPTVQSDILQGEIYDARREQAGWDKPGFDDGTWAAVDVTPRSTDAAVAARVDVTARIRALVAEGKPVAVGRALVPRDPYQNQGKEKGLQVEYRINGEVKSLWIAAPRSWTPPVGLKASDVVSASYGGAVGSWPTFTQRAHPTETVRPQGELSAQAITEPKPGIYVVDFGQNFAGWVRLKVSGRSGQSVYLRFAEEVKPDGTIYTDNLRSANPADRYICKGNGVETWEPRFTYHGFRYVQIVGLTAKPTKEMLTGIVAHSGGPITSTFTSSSPMLDRLYQNVMWSQRSNYFETMTDCPQRDERYGWVGDAHFFMATSAYNQNAASFFTKWFFDCVDSQSPNGNISNGCPRVSPGTGNAQLDWSAAMMVTPWMIWKHYGDAQPIIDHYDALRKYMTLWQKFADDADAGRGKKDGGYADFTIGDWCTTQRGKPGDLLIGRVYAYNLSLKMTEFARIAGHGDDVRTFSDLASRLRSTIIAKHIAADGTVGDNTQTGYAIVIRSHLYEPAQEALIRQKFQARMIADTHGVKTGFLGTGNLLQAMSTIDLVGDASQTILSEKSPSWGNMVKLGATTIWEHFDSKNEKGDLRSPYMNSFNHYTFGGCGEWMMGWLVGLRSDAPGFKTVLVEPSIIPGIDWVAGSFETPYGTISNHWARKDGHINMHLIIPPNSTARVVLPQQAARIILNGAKADGREIAVGSGVHDFSWAE